MFTAICWCCVRTVFRLGVTGWDVGTWVKICWWGWNGFCLCFWVHLEGTIFLTSFRWFSFAAFCWVSAVLSVPFRSPHTKQSLLTSWLQSSCSFSKVFCWGLFPCPRHPTAPRACLWVQIFSVSSPRCWTRVFGGNLSAFHIPSIRSRTLTEDCPTEWTWFGTSC